MAPLWYELVKALANALYRMRLADKMEGSPEGDWATAEKILHRVQNAGRYSSSTYSMWSEVARDHVKRPCMDSDPCGNYVYFDNIKELQKILEFAKTSDGN